MRNLIAIGGDRNEVLFFDAETGQGKGRALGCTSSILDLQFNSLGTLLAAASGDNSIYIWSLENFGLVKVLTGHISRVVSIKFSQDSSRIPRQNCEDLGGVYRELTILVTGHMDCGIRAWNVQTGNKIRESKVSKDAIVALDLSQDKGQILASSRDGTISVLDSTSFDRLWTLS
ncbi:hypothetical protein BB560_000766 [Smittium megazygosporum]|uniref:Uncharacterized protein n=1 Tax=Smittium megazygosporum TaxID=133381 RepID=A0A2T9ZJI4_9FUNG|nr:hypothetical protein BB560_000766 [Smittium megazygosporum]